MVKILQAYNFAAQDTFSLNGEFLAATLIDTQRIAISSADQFIEIYDIAGKHRVNSDGIPSVSSDSGMNANPLDGGCTENVDERSPPKYSLATVGEVVNLMYCEAGKYLLTLEKENVGSPVHSNSTSISCTSSSNSAPVYSEDDTKLFVRIYANFWKFPEAKLIDLPIVIRIASMTTPKAPLVENIDVIELPMRSAPDLIQCCQTSGNIIVSSKERIYLFEYTQCTHENTQPRFSYIDFLPFKFFVNLNFVPLRLCLAENVIACMNNRYCVAFKVVDTLSAAATTTGGGGGAGGHGSEEYWHEFYGNEADPPDPNPDADVVSTSESSMGSRGSGGPLSSRNSFESDSLETTSTGGAPVVCGVAGLPGRTPIDFNVARLVNSACGRGEFEVDLKSQWDQPEAANTCGPVGSGGNTNFNCSIDTQEIVITPMRASEIKIKLVNEAKAMNVQRIPSRGADYAACNEDTSVQYDIRKLLQICMKTSEPSERVLDILRCMDLRAIYQRSADGDIDDLEYDMGNQQQPGAVSSSKHLNRRTLKSGRHHSCVGYALLVASSVDGYLYQFCAQGKWYNENEKPIATYSFTAPVLRVHINDYVIYAITTESVETHTSRIGHKLFNNRFEYPSIGGLFPEESTSPDVNAAIAVIGLCSFMQVQFVCVSRDNLILISSSSAQLTNGSHCLDLSAKRRSAGAVVEVKRNIAARLLAARAKHSSLLRGSSHAAQSTAVPMNEWTLYKLELPAVESVVEDLEGIAETYRVASSSNFYDLMEEAHVMLRLSLSLQCELLVGKRDQILRKRFMDNCRKLADFSIRSNKREVYLQATGFYKMCNLQLPEIYANYISNATTTSTELIGITYSAEQLTGLLYTVKLFLLNLGSNRQKGTYLHSMVKPFFTTHLNVADIGNCQVPLSLELLHMFVQYAPTDVPPIMLQSPVVADSISSELVNYLKSKDKLSDEESLLLAVTACRMSNYMLSQEIINKISRRNLATALIKYKNVLFDDGTILFQKPRTETKLTVNNGRTIKKTVAGHSMRRQQQQQQQQQRKFTPVNPQARCQNGGSLHISFSDFTETILLATENSELIEAISDAFIHALCIEHSIGLDTIVQLFLNYIASHIGQKGYQTSQKVFVNILQVFFYDYYDVSTCLIQQNNVAGVPNDLQSHTPPQLEEDFDEISSKMPSLNSERDNNSIGGETNSGATSSVDEPTSGRNNRIVYDQLFEQQSPFKRGINFSPSQFLAADIDTISQSDSHDDEVNLKSVKILFRMYLGRMKALSDLLTDLQSADIEQQSINEEFLALRMECIKFMLHYLHEMRLQQQQQQQQRQSAQPGRLGQTCYSPPTTTATATGTHLYYAQNIHAKSIGQARSSAGGSTDKKLISIPYMPDYKLSGEEYERHIKDYIRPIPCLLDRPQYLNRLPPFKRTDFSYPKVDEGETDVHFLGWHNELLTLTLKIQSLLASPRIDREIVEEFIAFIQKSPDLIGIDSFLVIVLPKHLAINYMMNFCPEFLWQYGKSNGFTPRHWESLLRKMLSKQELLPNWKEHIKEILNNLVVELSFEELLQCFPNEVIQQRDPAQFLSEYKEHHIELHLNETKDKQQQQQMIITTDSSMYQRNHLPMDNIDESNVFELTLRKAVAKQRSIALRSMIESTGTQLFDVTNNPMYNL